MSIYWRYATIKATMQNKLAIIDATTTIIIFGSTPLLLLAIAQIYTAEHRRASCGVNVVGVGEWVGGAKNAGHRAFTSAGILPIVPFSLDGASITYAAMLASSKCQSIWKWKIHTPGLLYQRQNANSVNEVSTRPDETSRLSRHSEIVDHPFTLSFTQSSTWSLFY